MKLTHGYKKSLFMEVQRMLSDGLIKCVESVDANIQPNRMVVLNK